MKPRSILMAITFTSGIAAFVAESALAEPSAPVVFERNAKKQPPAKKAAGPAAIAKKLALSPKSLRFGMSLDELSRAYDAEIDTDYVEVYRRVEPGPRMQELDHEVAEKKALIQRSFIEFDGTPSGLDNGPLGGEFTYRNDESMSKLTLRSGVTRYFFFFGKRLWKILDEHKLSDKSKLGKDYENVLENRTKKLGKAPRAQAPDAHAKRLFDSADWADGTTILRVYDLGGGKAAVLYVDQSIEERLSKYRTHSGDGNAALDEDVAAITRDDSAPPPKADTDASKRKGKK